MLQESNAFLSSDRQRTVGLRELRTPIQGQGEPETGLAVLLEPLSQVSVCGTLAHGSLHSSSHGPDLPLISHPVLKEQRLLFLCLPPPPQKKTVWEMHHTGCRQNRCMGHSWQDSTTVMCLRAANYTPLIGQISLGIMACPIKCSQSPLPFSQVQSSISFPARPLLCCLSTSPRAIFLTGHGPVPLPLWIFYTAHAQ